MGLSPGEAAAHCLDFDLACMWFGQLVDARREETREVPVSKNERKRHTKRVPKYRKLDQALGIAPVDSPQAEEPVKPEIEQKVDELRRNPKELADFLRLNGE